MLVFTDGATEKIKLWNNDKDLVVSFDKKNYFYLMEINMTNMRN